MKRLLFALTLFAALPTTSFAQFWPGDSGRSLDTTITSCTIAASSAKDAKTQAAIFDACVASAPVTKPDQTIPDTIMKGKDRIIPDVIMDDKDQIIPDVIMDRKDLTIPDTIMKPKG